MGHLPSCPRCGGSVRAPGLWNSAWTCAEHGSIAPYHVLQHPTVEALAHVSQLAMVPVWRSAGLRPGWGFAGVAYAGDDRGGARATVTAAAGPAPLGGPADLLLVAEEPGIGLGAHLAGVADIDPGDHIASGQPDGRVIVERHPTALWPLPAAADDDGCAGFVGEAMGLWLWLIIWPAAAGIVVYDGLELVDHRHAATEVDLPTAAPTTRLAPRPGLSSAG